MPYKKTDEFGVDEIRAWAKILFAFSILYTYIGLMANVLVHVECATGNIKTYMDAFWVLQMSASTIGFGDFYPITSEGRAIVAFSFYVGVGLAGYIGTVIASVFTGFTDKSVQNRELRKQNAEILELLRKQYEPGTTKEIL